MGFLNTIYKLGEIVVKQNPDSVVKEHVKRWLRLPQNANMSHLYLPTKHLGLKFLLLSDIYACCQLTTRNISKTIASFRITRTLSTYKTKIYKRRHKRKQNK